MISRRGRPVVRWENRVKEYMLELLIEGEGLNKQGGNEASETIYR